MLTKPDSCANMSNFGNRIAVVTGAGKGIGKSIAQRFMKEGVQGLALLDFDFERVSQTARELDPECIITSGSYIIH